jgi:D-xylose transport system substrate-binding protein
VRNILTRRSAVLAAVLLVISACGTTAPATQRAGTPAAGTPAAGTPRAGTPAAGTPAAGTPATSPGANDGELVVGISWNNYDQPRWACCDAPGIKQVVEDAGGRVIETVAANSTEIQLSNIDGLIAQGMDVLILLAKDPDAMQAKLTEVKDLGIPIIGYDRLVEDEDVFYITFDNQGVGRIMAEVITELVPEGNYAIIKGHSADPNADFLRAGMDPVLKEHPGITIPDGCENYSDDWKTENANANMVACLGATDNDIQAVLSENDSMAGGVIAALGDVGLEIPVSGQDGDIAALHRVALGTQTVSVWKDSFELGKVAGAVAVSLYNGTQMSGVDISDLEIADYAAPPLGTKAVQFETPGGNSVWSITLNPNPVQIDNLNEPIESGWADAAQPGDTPGDGKAFICEGVDPSDVPACQ